MGQPTVEDGNAAETLGQTPRRSNRPAGQAAYRDLFLRSMDSILLVDITSGDILEANQASSNIFRLPLERLEGSNIYQYCDKKCLVDFKKMIRIATRRYHPKTFEVQMRVGEPRRSIIGEMSASPLQLEDETEVLQLIFRDITEKKEAERKIAEYIKQIEAANKKLEELAITDGMTGLTNFREFIRLLQAEHRLASRYHSAFSIIFTDIDNFKEYNDHSGHPAGDELLKGYASILKNSIRISDTAARYGGEEFVILCPHTNADQACVLAERIRTTLTGTKFHNAEKQPLGFISVSMGVSTFPYDGGDWQTVLNAADKALYQSKRKGRNRITVSRLAQAAKRRRKLELLDFSHKLPPDKN